MRRFTIWTQSGGTVAEGVLFADGAAAVRWDGKTLVYGSLQAVDSAHCSFPHVHGGKAEVQWIDPDLPRAASAR